MKIVYLPKTISAVIFDLDMTLYNNREYYDSQRSLLFARAADELGTTVSDIFDRLGYTPEGVNITGKQESTGEALLRIGITLAQNIAWREALFMPEEFLRPDIRLADTLKALRTKAKLAVVSNNPTSVITRTLVTLEIDSFFNSVMGPDISGEIKPSIRPFELTANRMKIPIQEAVSVGDRLEIDIEIPVKNGMGGILISELNELYNLPRFILAQPD